MGNRVLFQMHSGFRSQLIEKHEFYVQQAQKRLLEQFTDEAISQECDQVEEDTWNRYGQHFDPDIHDGSEGVDAATSDGVWRYELLTELRDSVRLNIIAGFFHEWEKNLRQWIVDEIQKWHHGELAKDRIWKANLAEIFELLESFGWSLRSADYFPHLDACRLVVNVYKHGNGPSLNELSNSFPNFLEHPFETMRDDIGEMWLKPSHEHLKVSDMNLKDFSDAIAQFWSSVPENIFSNQITKPPNWLMKAIEKDRNASGEK